MNILYVTSEAAPLVKTGGLGDVSGSLPRALQRRGFDVRLILPGYRRVLDRLEDLERVGIAQLPHAVEPVEILRSTLPGSQVPIYVVHSPRHFDRVGDLYLGSDQRDWRDNPDRFAIFDRVAAAVALDQVGLGWRSDIVHANDWQTGLVPGFLKQATVVPPVTLFTIHNLAYQGLFSAADFERLALPSAWWSMEGAEFYGQLSFLKAGLVHSDWLTTVSPNYAREIQTAIFGAGFDGLLRSRADRLIGILNGIDTQIWDPAHDPWLPVPYHRDDRTGKAENKRALQQRFELDEEPQRPLLGFIGRLVDQKGIDILIDALDPLLARGLAVVIIGSGQRTYERQLRTIAERRPGRLGLLLGFDDEAAHLVEGGADLFAMPSRFEPCGLNQLYSLRYGTVPVVRRTGGLADTVIEATDEKITAGTGTGFLFDAASAEGLLQAVDRALRCYHQSERWSTLMLNGMHKDFSWDRASSEYQVLYQRLVGPGPTGPVADPMQRRPIRKSAAGKTLGIKLDES